jgi:hypothetical protein
MAASLEGDESRVPEDEFAFIVSGSFHAAADGVRGDDPVRYSPEE